MDKGICLTVGCGREASLRGLCRACYNSAQEAVKDGKVPSWDFLVENGMALAPRSQKTSVFSARLAEKLDALSKLKAADIIHKQ